MSEKENNPVRMDFSRPNLARELSRNTLALVLAGGEGSRLKNLTHRRAKPAVPFGGKYRIIDFALSNCVNSGIRRIGVLTQYKSDSLIRHMQRAWNFMRAEIGEFVEILPAQQRTAKKEWYQGTADALYQNLDILHRHDPEYVIVLGGDHIYKMDYSDMLVQHVLSGADFTVGCIEVPVEEATGFGVMSVDEDMHITKFTEKPKQPEHMPGKPGIALASMGIYVFSREFLFRTLSEDALSDDSSNLYDRLWPIWTYQPQYPPAKFVFDEDGRRGEAIDSLVSAGCILSGARMKRSVTFFAVTIGNNSLVKDSIILPKVSIGQNCRLTKVIVDKGCVIPDNTVIGENLEEDKKRFYVTEEGIVLVTLEMLGQSLSSRDKEHIWRMDT